MPGKRITDHQVHKYKQHRNQLSQVASAAKAGISERSARRIEDANHLPSQRPERNWRTRPDGHQWQATGHLARVVPSRLQSHSDVSRWVIRKQYQGPVSRQQLCS